MTFDWEYFKKEKVLVHCTTRTQYNDFCKKSQRHLHDFRTSDFSETGKDNPVCNIYCHTYYPYLAVTSAKTAELYEQFEWADYMDEE